MHALNMLAGLGFLIWPQYVQTCFVFMHGVDHPTGQLLKGLAILVRATNDLVIDVGNVANVGQVIAAVAKPA